MLFFFSMICVTLWMMTSIMSCTHEKLMERAGIKKIELIPTEGLKLTLDSITTQNTVYIQVCDSMTLAFLNEPSFEIEFYNLINGQLINKISLSKDGPNATPGIESFYYQNEDSIWLYASWGNRLYLINSMGEVRISRDMLIPQSGLYTSNPYPQTTTPYVVKGKYHYLQGMNGANSEMSLPASSVVYDWDSDSVFMGNIYPGCYGNYDNLTSNWDAFSFRQTSCVLNNDGKIVTSFPASDSIYVYNPWIDKRESYFAGLTEPIEITSHKSNGYTDIFVNYITQYQYAGIVYDKFRKLYYRIVLHPYKDYDSNDLRNECRKKPISIIVLDEKFKKVGETMLPNNLYYPGNAFVTMEGLNIQVYSQDDDIMEFGVFEPNEL